MSRYVDIEPIIESIYAKWGGDPAYYVNDTPTGCEVRRDAELIERLRSQPSVDIVRFRWHKYPDEKPEKEGRYLVCSPSMLCPRAPTIDIVWWGKSWECEERDKSLKKKKAYWNNTDPEWGDYTVDDVYAWMPLPEPMPMEEKTDER